MLTQKELTDIELKVLGFIASGGPYLQIANTMMIPFPWVKKHVAHIRKKLGVMTDSQAVDKWREWQATDNFSDAMNAAIAASSFEPKQYPRLKDVFADAPWLRKVIWYVAAGYTNKETAEKMRTSKWVVMNNVATILRKIGAESKLEIAQVAFDQKFEGLDTVPPKVWEPITYPQGLRNRPQQLALFPADPHTQIPLTTQ